MCDGHRDPNQCIIFLRPRAGSNDRSNRTKCVFYYRYEAKLISIVVKCVCDSIGIPGVNGWTQWRLAGCKLVWACTINTIIAKKPVLLQAIHFPIHTLRHCSALPLEYAGLWVNWKVRNFIQNMITPHLPTKIHAGCPSTRNESARAHIIVCAVCHNSIELHFKMRRDICLSHDFKNNFVRLGCLHLVRPPPFPVAQNGHTILYVVGNIYSARMMNKCGPLRNLKRRTTYLEQSHLNALKFSLPHTWFGNSRRPEAKVTLPMEMCVCVCVCGFFLAPRTNAYHKFEYFILILMVGSRSSAIQASLSAWYLVEFFISIPHELRSTLARRISVAPCECIKFDDSTAHSRLMVRRKAMV